VGEVSPTFIFIGFAAALLPILPAGMALEARRPAQGQSPLPRGAERVLRTTAPVSLQAGAAAGSPLYRDCFACK
jgi:hypothetical protein